MAALAALGDCVEQGDQSRGAQRCQQLDLVTLASHVIGIGQVGTKNFERDGAPERFVYGPIYRGHPSDPQYGLHPKPFGQEVPNGEVGERRSISGGGHVFIIRHSG